MNKVKETVEQFLARGGTITKCPPSWECPDPAFPENFHWTTPTQRRAAKKASAYVPQRRERRPQGPRPPISDAHKASIAEAQRKRWAERKADPNYVRRPMSEAHKRKISEAKKGKPMKGWNAESRARASERMKGNKRRLGTKHSPDTLAKIAASCYKAALKRYGHVSVADAETTAT